MNQRDREKLHAELELPDGFDADEHDDFINWVRPEGHPQSWRSTRERVIRIVGQSRCLVLFPYPERNPPLLDKSKPLFYLDVHRGLVEFPAHGIMKVAERMAGQYVSWDRVIGDWLVQHGAMTFTGRGWADNCAVEIAGMIRLWQRYYNHGLREG